VTTFFDQENNPLLMLTAGGLEVRLTNESTGKSIDVNISGPIQQEPQPDGSFKITNVDPTLFDFDLGVAPNLPRLALFDGRAQSMFNPQNNNFSLQSLRGSIEDACALLS
jgi:hypothetical protein